MTGFGLLGHLGEMLGRGDVGARVEADAVPVLEAAWDLVQRDVVPAERAATWRPWKTSSTGRSA